MLSINKFINKLFHGHGNKQALEAKSPTLLPHSEHTISRKSISKSALKVLYTLKDAGFDAYLVGGCVRDLLLGMQPKDFDVATNALPEQVHELFKRSRLIGRRFKLVHVHFGREVIEVATFRAPPQAANHVDGQGRIVQDNVYGTLEQDAWRRDFTINALYYNIQDFSIIDYTGGVADLEAGVIRLIGDVETRYREDPVRMLRALRFVAKLGLQIEAKTEAGIYHLSGLLKDIPAARLFDETLKLYLSGYASKTHQLLVKYQLFSEMFPQSAQGLVPTSELLLQHAFENTDQRIADGKPVTPAFLFAAILWEPVVQQVTALKKSGTPDIPAIQKASAEVIAEQVKTVAIPKRFSLITKDIWGLQPRLQKRQGKRTLRTLVHPKFRAGYDFLLLRQQSGESLKEEVEWWTSFQEVDETQQLSMINALSGQGTARKKPRRRRRRRASVNTENLKKDSE